MKALLVFLMTALTWILAIGAALSQPYYYASGNQVPLKIDSAKITIKFDEGISSLAREQLLASIGRIDENIEDDHLIDDFAAFTLTTSDGYSAFVDSIGELDGVYQAEPYYLNDLDSAFLVGTRFCVAFDESLGWSEIQDLADTYNVTIDHEVAGMPNVLVLRNTDSSGFGTL